MLLRPVFGPRFGRPGLIGPAARPAVVAGGDGPARGLDDRMVAHLKELAALHQAGDLTDDEFARAKARVLG